MKIVCVFLFTFFFANSVFAISLPRNLCSWLTFGTLGDYDNLLNKERRINGYLEWTDDLNIFFQNVPSLKPSEKEWIEVERNSGDVSRLINLKNSKEYSILTSLIYYKNISVTLKELISAAKSENREREKIYLGVLALNLTNDGQYSSINNLFRYGVLKGEEDYSPKILRSLYSGCMAAAHTAIKLSLRDSLKEK